MIIYKITNTKNGKVYIGQTTRTLRLRWEQHIRSAKNGGMSKFYKAIRKYGPESFKVETLCTAYSKEELNDLEIYFIHKYNSIKKGYNMIDARYTNVMDFPDVKEKHDTKMRSEEVRQKLSNTMKQKIADGKFFNEHHRAELSKKAMGNKNGENNPSHSIGCYCVIDGVRRDFKNYKEAGIWWYMKDAPFGEKYSQATYQRKIIDCINTGECKFQKKDKTYIHITREDIQWYRKEGDVK